MKEDKRTSTVKFKLRFERGYYYIRYVQSFALITFLLDYFKLPYYFIVPIIIGAYLIGWLDERKGIWKKEASYGIDYLIEYYNRIEKKIDELSRCVNERRN